MMKRPGAAKDFFSLHLPEEVKAKIDLDSLQPQLKKGQDLQFIVDITGLFLQEVTKLKEVFTHKR